MEGDWAPSAVRDAGSHRLNIWIRRIRDDISPGGEYRIFRDRISHAADDSLPIRRSQWNLWRDVIVRFHLSEISDLRIWVALIARFYTMDIRSSLHEADSLF